jgi:hypothetical protein
MMDQRVTQFVKTVKPVGSVMKWCGVTQEKNQDVIDVVEL